MAISKKPEKLIFLDLMNICETFSGLQKIETIGSKKIMADVCMVPGTGEVEEGSG